jgi:hypothetical protein
MTRHLNSKSFNAPIAENVNNEQQQTLKWTIRSKADFNPTGAIRSKADFIPVAKIHSKADFIPAVCSNI